MDDFEWVYNLLTAAQPLLAEHLYLKQWHIYASAYLTLEDKRQPVAAIALFESLRTQIENLAPNLPGRVLNSLGIAYEENEQWDRAIHCYQECIQLCGSRGDDLGLAKTWHNLAIVHFKGQDYLTAVDYAKRSIAILQELSSEPRQQAVLGNAQNELGLALQKLKLWLEASEALEQSLAIDIQLGKTSGEATSCNNLGHIARHLGDTLTAESRYIQARDLSHTAGNLREESEAHYGLGLLRLQTGHLDQAQQCFNAALALAQTTHNYEIITDIFLGRAELAQKQGDHPLALAENRQAVETVESLRANIVLPEDRAKLQGSRIEAYEQMVLRLCETGPHRADYIEAFRYAEMAKSRAFIETLAGRPLRPPENIPADWLARETELRQSLRLLYDDPAANQAQITPLEAELEQLRQRIRLQNAEFESFQTVDPLSSEEVMARLPADGVLVEYFTVGDVILAFVLTCTDIQVIRLPLRVQDVERAFSRTGDGKLDQLRHLTRGPDHRLREPWVLGQLCQRLIEPLGQKIWSASLLCIVPHGILHYIPFQALFQKDGSTPRYLLGDTSETHRLVYAPSAATLFDYCQRKTLSAQTGCLAFGYNDPALNLTQAEMEAERIAHLTAGVSRTGGKANRNVLFEEAANYRYLHLACHGRFNPTWPLASYLNLADGPVDVADLLYHLRLNADLVSLSACETGRNHVLRGDEMVGLTRAFLYAGTPSVVVSHWVVDELATRLLMERFYQELVVPSGQTDQATKAKALTRAQNAIRSLTVEELRQTLLMDGHSSGDIDRQLHYLATSAGYDSLASLRGDECLLAHPYYWASFFLVGDRF
jgi:CHAT domain-containing protein/Tfp pilus assembly protein PilF